MERVQKLPLAIFFAKEFGEAVDIELSDLKHWLKVEIFVSRNTQIFEDSNVHLLEIVSIDIKDTKLIYIGSILDNSDRTAFRASPNTRILSCGEGLFVSSSNLGFRCRILFTISSISSRGGFNPP